MNHVYHWGRAFADNIVGPAKAGGLDPAASAARHGLRASYHSDYTVTDMHPLRSVQTAVTRKVQDGGAVLNADERVTVAQAMAAVTIDAAWQIHADDTNGTLEVGKFADIVVLSDDPLDVDPDAIADIQVVRTLLGGDVTHQA
jgi:predicted amidohydrolase YtcJ